MRLYGTVVEASCTFQSKSPLQTKRRHNAIQMLIEQTSTAHAAMMKMSDEHQLGLRHLANMMGADPATFTQEQADVCMHPIRMLIFLKQSVGI